MRLSCLQYQPTAITILFFLWEVLTRMYRPGADRVYQIGVIRRVLWGLRVRQVEQGPCVYYNNVAERCGTVAVHRRVGVDAGTGLG